MVVVATRRPPPSANSGSKVPTSGGRTNTARGLRAFCGARARSHSAWAGRAIERAPTKGSLGSESRAAEASRTKSRCAVAGIAPRIAVPLLAAALTNGPIGAIRGGESRGDIDGPVAVAAAALIPLRCTLASCAIPLPSGRTTTLPTRRPGAAATFSCRAFGARRRAGRAMQARGPARTRAPPRSKAPGASGIPTHCRFHSKWNYKTGCYRSIRRNQRPRRSHWKCHWHWLSGRRN